jgi:hypothetical protein
LPAILGPEVCEVKRSHLQRFCFVAEMSSEYVRSSRSNSCLDSALPLSVWHAVCQEIHAAQLLWCLDGIPQSVLFTLALR